MWDKSLMFYKMVRVLLRSVPFHLEKKKGVGGKNKEKQRKIKCKRIRRVVPNIHPFPISQFFYYYYIHPKCVKKIHVVVHKEIEWFPKFRVWLGFYKKMES
jgi:hypothetical protein